MLLVIATGERRKYIRAEKRGFYREIEASEKSD
jgi:hypothetical protein